MSSGTFTTSKYELSSDNGGYIVKCRVQPETLTATFASTENDPPAGAINAPGSARSSKGRREFGIGMRYVTIEFTGTLPTGYSGDLVKIPVLTPATYAAWTEEATGTYLGVAAKIKSKSLESVK